jgi:hypothetical protein
LLVLAALGVASGCRSNAAEAAEAARLTRLVEVLREADNADKQSALAALEAHECAAQRLCQLQATCLRGYREHVDAYARLQRAQANPADAPPNLDAIEASLTAAQRDIKACADAEAAVRRTYDQ